MRRLHDLHHADPFDCDDNFEEVAERALNSESDEEKTPSLPDAKDMGIMDIYVHLSKALRGSHLNIPSDTLPYVMELCSRLELTPIEVLLLIPILNNYDCDSMYLSAFAKYFGVSKLEMLCQVKNFESLRDRGYFTLCNCDGIRVSLCDGVVKALSENRKFVPKNLKVSNDDELMSLMDRVVHEANDERLEMDDILSKLKQVLDANKDMEFCQKTDSLLNNGTDEDEIPLLVAFFLEIHHKGEDYLDPNDLSNYFGWCNNSEIHMMVNQLKRNLTTIQSSGLVEQYSNDGLNSADRWTLTDKAFETFLHIKRETKKVEYLQEASSIVAKEMFYNPEEEKAVGKLTSLLMPERFAEVQRRLQEQGTRKGFACLFYGAPGTGKTETVLQLACSSGRDIMRVDVADVKSKWVGESEQNIKMVFERYRNLCRNAEKHGKPLPILLFNEADQLFGARLKSVRNAVDKMENSMQNIILEQVENLDGILIATTNLNENFDSAFARRFLYKIKFNTPTPEARASIWKSKLSGVDAESVSELAKTYKLSGGQIENIARKCSVDFVLNDEQPTFEKLSAYAREELQLSRPARNVVGFRM